MEGGALRRTASASRCEHKPGSQSSPLHLVSPLTGKVAALPGFKAITEVTFPPLIGLVEMTHLYFVGFRMLCKPVAKSEVAIETHEFSKINIGNTRVRSEERRVGKECRSR